MAQTREAASVARPGGPITNLAFVRGFVPKPRPPPPRVPLAIVPPHRSHYLAYCSFHIAACSYFYYLEVLVDQSNQQCKKNNKRTIRKAASNAPREHFRFEPRMMRVQSGSVHSVPPSAVRQPWPRRHLERCPFIGRLHPRYTQCFTWILSGIPPPSCVTGRSAPS